MLTETRRCTACGGEVKTKRQPKDMAGKHADCGGLLMKARLYAAEDNE